jgi:hypothetical protein
MCGIRKALEVLQECNGRGEVCDRPDLCIDFEEHCNIMGLPAIKELENRFLPEEVLTDKYGR